MNIAINFHIVGPFFVLLLVTLVNVIFGLIVFVRTHHKAYGRYFALTMLGAAGWALGDLVMLYSRNPNAVHLGAEFFYISPMLAPVFIWFFAMSFPEGQRPKRWHTLLALMSFAILTAIFLAHFNFFVKDISITRSLNVPSPKLPGFLIYSGYFSVFFLFAYAAFWSKIRRLRGLKKTQVAYTFYGALGASLPALVTNLSFPVMGIRDLIWVGPIFTLLFATTVTLAIVRHKLFDIRFYTVRSVAYILTLLVTVVLYVVPTILITTYLLHTPLKAGSVLLLASITLIVAFLFQSVKKLLNHITNRFFYQDAYDPQILLDRLNRTLVADIDLEVLLRDCAALIGESLKTEFCIFNINKTALSPARELGIVGKHRLSEADMKSLRHLTKEVGREAVVTDDLGVDSQSLQNLLRRNSVSVLAQIAKTGKGENRDLGYLLLGAKKSGNLYTGQDLRVIDIIANELAIAIQNALRFEEIESFNITLQQKVSDATKKLRRTNDKLRALDESKDEFISMASHQLRTPLTSVKGYVSMVLDGDVGRVNSMQRKLLEQAFNSSQRMVYLIADLLNVSRLKTGKFIIEASSTYLPDVVEGEIDQLKETAKGRGLELTYQKPAEFPWLRLDETKTRQVIMNFIDNAIYYTPSGGHIRVELEDKDQSVEFRVIDDGLGVPKAEQHHLFTKFYRAANARQARPDGTGLGLFMAQKVIVAQGGAILFKSQEGKGSTFGFTFPLGRLQVARGKAQDTGYKTQS